MLLRQRIWILINSLGQSVATWRHDLLLLIPECRHTARNDVLLDSRTLPLPSDAIWRKSKRHFHWLFVHCWWRYYDKNLFQPIEKWLTVYVR